MILDVIIEKRMEILNLVKPFGVSSLKLYGSVLARKEHDQSDIDFLVDFEEGRGDYFTDTNSVKEALEQFFDKRIGIVNKSMIPEIFRPGIETDPIDIMELQINKVYRTTPKSSALYYKTIRHAIDTYNRGATFEPVPSRESLSFWYTGMFALRMSWWISRLLRLDDNDVRTTDHFNYIEAIRIMEDMAYSMEIGANEVIWMNEIFIPGLEKFLQDKEIYNIA